MITEATATTSLHGNFSLLRVSPLSSVLFFVGDNGRTTGEKTFFGFATFVP
jgi:hypothetical protein